MTLEKNRWRICVIINKINTALPDNNIPLYL